MKKYSLFLLLLALITSCAPVYIPNARHTPQFKGAGEFQANAQISQGFDVQAAVSITNHIGVMANFANTSHTSVEDNEDYVKHRFFEGAVGYYENTGKFSYEIFGGFGKGEGTAYDTYDISSSTQLLKATGKYNRIFIQPSFGQNRKIFQWAVAARFSWIDFTSFEADDQTLEYNTDPILMFEPSFVSKINFGSSKIFMTFQAGISVPQGDPFFDYEPVFASVGMGLRLGKSNDKDDE